MKRNIYYSILFAFVGLTCFSCSEDELDSKSVIVDSQVSENEFDIWLNSNFVTSYNVQFLYRYQDNETDMNYYNVPADYTQAVKLAHIIKYACVEAYDQVAGVAFTRQFFPKMLYATGEFEYLNNGTMILGTAEGGKKVFLCGTNHLDEIATNIDDLNEYYLKTIHHEFGHILNQTKDFSVDYKQITGSLYISDNWSTSAGINGFLSRGFITAYSQKSADEDFVEMYSTYISKTPEQWAELMDEAGKDGAAVIDKKLSIVRDYMLTNFDINIDDMRNEVIRREYDIINGTVNLVDLKVE